MVGSRGIPAAGGDTWRPGEPGLRITGFLKGEKQMMDLKLTRC